MRRFLDWADYAVRIAFFAVAPFCVFVLAAIFPVTATLVNIGLCLLVVSFADVVRHARDRVPMLKLVLTGPLAFEQYYRAHPPKGFAYYVFYPLLFPYWLVVDHARREFLLYKTINLLSIALLIGSTIWDYHSHYRPELGVIACISVLSASVLLEVVVIMLMLMPMATSLVTYRLTGRRGRMITLLLVGAISVGAAALTLSRQRDPIVSWAAKERVILRTHASRPKARAVQLAAAKAAWLAIPKRRPDDVDADGKVEGAAMDEARKELIHFYKKDEAQAFDGWVSHATKTKHELLVLYVEARGSKKPVLFVAVDRAGHEVKQLKDLPAGALKAMKTAADGIAVDL